MRKHARWLPHRIESGELSWPDLKQEWEACGSVMEFAAKYRSSVPTCRNLFGIRRNARGAKKRPHQKNPSAPKYDRAKEVEKLRRPWKDALAEHEKRRKENEQAYRNADQCPSDR
jgi:hypothetical protein